MTSQSHRSRNASPQFRSIKAVFEQADVPTPRPFSRGSKPRTPTNDDQPSPVASLISRESFRNQQETIDALLEASSTQQWPSSRDQLRPKSSWIGPLPTALKLSHKTISTMARKVTVTYSSPGLQPPVYITTSLSEPQWDLLEMDCGELPSGEREFAKTFHVAEGEYQYKFRLGPGDWWVCDEDKPTLDDGLGNRNNVLVVKDDVTPTRHAAEPQSSVDDGVESHSPTLPHEQNYSKAHVKRDSLGDDVISGSEAHDDKHEAPLFPHEENDHHGAPLLSHEKIASPRSKLDVPPETVPVSFSRQDSLALDDDDPDVEPAESSGAPTFDHERDVETERIPTPDVFDDEDDDHQPPLMSHEVLSPAPVKPSLKIDEDEDDAHDPPLLSHETLSPASAKHGHNLFETKNHGKHHHDYDSEAVSSPTSSNVPEEADPNDPSLEEFPTHHEGIMSSLRRSSMRMAEHETRPDVHDSTSPIAKTVSQSSQSPSLPSVIEDKEDEEGESVEAPQKDAHAHAPNPHVHGLATGLPVLSGDHERPAALMTPPRTPDESKDPSGASSTHHHSPVAEENMHEEASHDVKHHDSHHPQHHHKKAADKPASLDGDSEPNGSGKAESKEEPKPKKPEAGVADKSSRSGMFETALGLGLVVAVGVGAVLLAFMMQDPIKDGGAALTGAS